MIDKRARIASFIACLACFVLITLSGCIEGPCGRTFRGRTVTGTALDAESMQPLANAVIRMTSLTAGDVNANGSTALRNSQPPDSETGAFDIGLISNFSGDICGDPLPELPLADEIRVTVILDGCEQELTIAIDSDTAVEITDGDRVTEIQLLDAILVPPCPPTDETAEPAE